MSVPSPVDPVLLGKPTTPEPCSNARRHGRPTMKRMHLCSGVCGHREGLRACRGAGCCKRGAGLAAVQAEGRSARGRSPRDAGHWPRDRDTDTLRRLCLPATPTLRLRVKRAETAIASSAPKLSRSAFSSDIHPSRGGKFERKNSSVNSLLSPLLTTLPRDPKPH